MLRDTPLSKVTVSHGLKLFEHVQKLFVVLHITIRQKDHVFSTAFDNLVILCVHVLVACHLAVFVYRRFIVQSTYFSDRFSVTQSLSL